MKWFPERNRWFGLFARAIVFLLIGLVLLRVPPADAQDAAAPSAAPSTGSAENAAWLNQLNVWRAHREQEIDAPDGWLTLVGLEWLKPGLNSVGVAEGNQIRLTGHAPDRLGVISVNGATVELQPPDGGFPPDLEVDGKPARAGTLTVIGAKPSVIAWHTLTLVTLNRGGRYVLRIKDAEAPARAAFHGLSWYAPDPHFRVEAKWIPYAKPQIENIPTVLGTTLDLPSPGVAEFILYGKTIHLEPVLEDPAGQTLFFILRDQTRYDATYEAARYLHTGLPDHGLDKPGLLMLDFNRLENPPCAYTPYATCPLPPIANRLLVQLQAGEKRYTH